MFSKKINIGLAFTLGVFLVILATMGDGSPPNIQQAKQRQSQQK